MIVTHAGQTKNVDVLNDDTIETIKLKVVKAFATLRYEDFTLATDAHVKMSDVVRTLESYGHVKSLYVVEGGTVTGPNREHDGPDPTRDVSTAVDPTAILLQIEVVRLKVDALAPSKISYDRIQPSENIPVIQWKQFYKVDLRNSMDTLKDLVVEKSLRRHDELGEFWKWKNDKNERVIFRTKKASAFVNSDGTYDVWFEKGFSGFADLKREVAKFNDRIDPIIRRVDAACVDHDVPLFELMEIKTKGKIERKQKLDLIKVKAQLEQAKHLWMSPTLDAKGGMLQVTYKRTNRFFEPDNMKAIVHRGLKESESMEVIVQRLISGFELPPKHARELANEQKKLFNKSLSVPTTALCVVELDQHGEFKVGGRVREAELHRCLNRLVEAMDESLKKPGTKAAAATTTGVTKKKINYNSDTESEESSESDDESVGNECPLPEGFFKEKHAPNLEGREKPSKDYGLKCALGFDGSVGNPERTKLKSTLKKELLAALQAADQPLFQTNWPKSMAPSNHTYASKCQKPNQPAVMKPRDLARNDKCFPGGIKSTLSKYGSTKERQENNVYSCPDVWFPKLKFALTMQQYNELMKPANAKYRFWETKATYKDDPIISYKLNKTRKLELKEIPPGSPEGVPGLCYPCCGSVDESKAVAEEMSTKAKKEDDYILRDNATTLGRWVNLPASIITPYFDLPFNSKKVVQVNYLTFMDCMKACFPNLDFIKTIKSNLSKSEHQLLYMSLDGGSVCRSFMPLTPTSDFSSAVDASIENFIKWIESHPEKMTHEHLLDLFTKAPWINVRHSNIICIIEKEGAVEKCHVRHSIDETIVIMARESGLYTLIHHLQKDKKYVSHFKNDAIKNLWKCAGAGLREPKPITGHQLVDSTMQVVGYKPTGSSATPPVLLPRPQALAYGKGATWRPVWRYVTDEETLLNKALFLRLTSTNVVEDKEIQRALAQEREESRRVADLAVGPHKGAVASLRQWYASGEISRIEALMVIHHTWKLNERQADELLTPRVHLRNVNTEKIIEFTKQDLAEYDLTYLLTCGQSRTLNTTVVRV